jgi:hypothetical protein
LNRRYKSCYTIWQYDRNRLISMIGIIIGEDSAVGCFEPRLRLHSSCQWKHRVTWSPGYPEFQEDVVTPGKMPLLIPQWFNSLVLPVYYQKIVVVIVLKESPWVRPIWISNTIPNSIFNGRSVPRSNADLSWPSTCDCSSSFIRTMRT